MAMQTLEDQRGENAAVNAGSQEIVPADSKEPLVPRGMTGEESRTLKERAADAVAHLEDASGSKELELITRIASVGTQAQRNAGGEMELLRARIGDVLTRGGPGAEVSNNLVDLRVALNQINPHEVAHQGIIRRLFGVLPFVEKFPSAMKVLEKVAMRYEPVTQQVAMIETKLLEGRAMLAGQCRAGEAV